MHTTKKKASEFSLYEYKKTENGCIFLQHILSITTRLSKCSKICIKQSLKAHNQTAFNSAVICCLTFSTSWNLPYKISFWLYRIGKCWLVQGKVYEVGDHTTICQEVLHCSGRMHRGVWKYPDQCNMYLRRITTNFGRKLRCYIDREKWIQCMENIRKQPTCHV